MMELLKEVMVMLDNGQIEEARDMLSEIVFGTI